MLLIAFIFNLHGSTLDDKNASFIPQLMGSDGLIE
jgi:hypothetical protein